MSLWDDSRPDIEQVSGGNDWQAFDVNPNLLVDNDLSFEVETEDMWDTNIKRIKIKLVVKPRDKSRPEGLLNVFERQQ
jgi:hypothetical protein